MRVVETEGAGMLFPARILTGLTVLLARQGVRLHAYTKVDAVDPERATVTAEGRILGADVVAVTAGAWADRLAPELRALATPSRQAVLYLAPPPRLATAWAEAPVLAHLGDEGGNYTLPPRRGTRLKVGDHTFSLRGDPDEFRLAPTPTSSGCAGRRASPTATSTPTPSSSARPASTPSSRASASSSGRWVERAGWSAPAPGTASTPAVDHRGRGAGHCRRAPGRGRAAWAAGD